MHANFLLQCPQFFISSYNYWSFVSRFFFVFRLMPSQRLSEPFINDTIMLSLFCRQI